MRARLSSMLIALVVLVGPALAQACAVCFGGEDDNRQAFIDTTVILTVAPLLMVGLFIWLLVRRIARVEALRQEQLRADQAAAQQRASAAISATEGSQAVS